MSHGEAKAFYHSQAWTNTRRAYLESVHYTCERCGKPAAIVHHRRYITPGNLNDVSITLDWANLEALCYQCHANEHMRTDSVSPGLTFNEAGDLVPLRRS